MSIAENITAQKDICSISLDEIRVDQRAQPRENLNTEITNAYAADMRAGVVFPPLTVFFDGDNYWLADGFHRRYAAIGEGFKEFRCDVRAGGLREAILFSCGANGAHGYRRSNDDKRRAVSRMLEDDEWRHWSNREIARRCNVDSSGAFVAKLRAEMESQATVTADICSDKSKRTYTNKHGTTSKMETGAIGKPNGSASPSGARIITPDGDLVSDVIRRGMALEGHGFNAEGVAKKLSLDRHTYRRGRDIVLLSDRKDLRDGDRAIVCSALAEMDDTRRVARAHEKVIHLVKKLWGAQGSHRNAKSTARLLEAFEDAITIIVDVCDRSKEISLPHLSREQAESTVEQLKLAADQLRSLKSRIEETLK